MRIVSTTAALALFLTVSASSVYPEIGTTLAVSAELGTSIAREEFPLTIKMGNTNLFLTKPVLLYVNKQRIAIQVHLQAYDHRPAEGVAVSETGQAQFSGELDFEIATRQVLLHKPKIDKLKFDRDSETTQRLLRELQTSWAEVVTDPLRSDLPQHPYLMPFKENIEDLSFDGNSINLTVVYQ